MRNPIMLGGCAALTGLLWFAAAGAGAPGGGILIAQAPRSAASSEQSAWEAARRLDTADAYLHFLEDFPAGTYAAEARWRQREIERSDATVPGNSISQRSRSRGAANPESAARELEKAARLPLQAAPLPGAGPSPEGASHPPAASTPSFAWTYDEKSGRLAVTINGREQGCQISDPAGVAGLGAYRDGSNVRINFERRDASGVHTIDSTLTDACMAPVAPPATRPIASIPPVPPTPVPTLPPLPAPIGSGPSFECSRHFAADELAVCRSTRLSELDQQMSALYGLLRGRMDPSRANQLRDDQRAWIRQRATCGSGERCLINLYESRVARLQSLL
jgi:hypothetical protein